MRRRRLVLAALWAICLPPIAAAMTCPATPDPALRSVFVEAERSPPRSAEQWKRLRSRLGDYPLFPYVELARLDRDFPRVERADLEAFLKRHDGEGVSIRLRNRWVRRLADHREWRKFIEWYPVDAPIELRCRHARALLESGDEAGAFAAAQELWMSGKSQPKACDPVFKVWLASDRFSPSLAWERIALAMDRGNTRLTRYLERFLDPAGRKLAGTWRAIHKNPQQIAKIRLDGEASRIEAIVVHGIQRLARSDPAAAVEALHGWRHATISARRRVPRPPGTSDCPLPATTSPRRSTGSGAWARRMPTPT